MRRRLWSVVTVALLVVGITACTTKPSTTANEQPPIVVGSTLSLTGAFAATGIIHKIAGEEFVERLNAAGGLLGRPVKWTVLDDQSDTTKVGAALRAADQPGQGRPDHRARTRRRTSSPRWRWPSGTATSCRTTPRCWRRS